MNRTVPVALLQRNAHLDPAINEKETFEAIRQAAARGAKVMLLQELFLSEYFCRSYNISSFDLAIPAGDPVFNRVSDLSASLGVVICFPFFERRAPGLFHNAVAVFDADGSHLGLYRKMHIPDDPGFYEKYYFTPGDLGYKVFRTRFLNIGVLICWDQWYPEAARITAMKGADLLYFPTAIGAIPGELPQTTQTIMDAWKTTQRSHGIDSAVFVASVNRVGTEETLRFWGNSFVSDPHGKIIWAAADREATGIVNLDLQRIEEIRKLWPFLRDRRIDSYQNITERFLI